MRSTRQKLAVVGLLGLPAWYRLGVPVYLAVLLTACAGAPPSGKKLEVSGVDAIVVEDDVAIPGEVEDDFRTAVGHFRSKNYELGVPLMKQVITRSPKTTAPYINLAMAYRAQGQHAEAEAAVKKALELNGRHPVANDEYAKILRRTGRFEEARAVYEKLLDEYPRFHPARRNLGILCDLYLNDAECALEHYQRYSEARPGDEKVPLWIADIKRRLGQ